MTIQQTIQKAIEGGWKSPRHYRLAAGNNAACGEYTVPLDTVFLDPLFWQSLGKAMGWDKADSCVCAATKPCRHMILRWKAPYKKLKNSLWHWHRFIDHLAEGKDAESFFEKL